MGDAGFLQCRPVGHKNSRRMVFVDYDAIEHATKGLMAHQGHKWDDVDEGLKIDYDKDARSKRNTAIDDGRFEKFWPRGPRRMHLESEGEFFARLKSESLDREFFTPSGKTTSQRPGPGSSSASNAKASSGVASEKTQGGQQR